MTTSITHFDLQRRTCHDVTVYTTEILQKRPPTLHMWCDVIRSSPIHSVTNSRAKPQQTPSVEKHAHPPRVVYCAIYSTLTRFTKSRVLKFAYFQGRLPRHNRISLNTVKSILMTCVRSNIISECEHFFVLI